MDGPSGLVKLVTGYSIDPIVYWVEVAGFDTLLTNSTRCLQTACCSCCSLPLPQVYRQWAREGMKSKGCGCKKWSLRSGWAGR